MLMLKAFCSQSQLVGVVVEMAVMGVFPLASHQEAELNIYYINPYHIIGYDDDMAAKGVQKSCIMTYSCYNPP